MNETAQIITAIAGLIAITSHEAREWAEIIRKRKRKKRKR